MQRYDNLKNSVYNKIIFIRFDINGYIENSFCYIAFKIK